MKNTNIIKTVISGSFRKHLQQIYELKKALEKENIQVLSPLGQNSINPKEEFVILDSDPVESPEILQATVFARIRNSTFLTLANFDGYMGRAATLEVGYAIAIGIKIYSIEKVIDPNINPFCSNIFNVLPQLELSNTINTL